PAAQPMRTAFALPEPVLEAARQFGRSFQQIVSATLAQSAGKEANLPGEDLDEALSSTITGLCSLMTNSILNELGLQNRDLARIY
ncbi:MAG TPA: hypothetical protein PLV24_12300, partial [Anaerolineaceae bacterium]|nr:hypothetical protein [Anaerolineaceae bacterium]